MLSTIAPYARQRAVIYLGLNDFHWQVDDGLAEAFYRFFFLAFGTIQTVVLLMRTLLFNYAYLSPL